MNDNNEKAVAERLPQVAGQVERLQVNVNKAEELCAILRGRIERILSPESPEAKSVGTPPMTDMAPLASTLTGLADRLSHVVYSLEDTIDRVEL